ncbi:MAG: RNA polymerase sigma factor [Deltaproteobacteria bacterium]|nr:RNA polymerase sigma factor [Deltaproteobacteria bacterium]
MGTDETEVLVRGALAGEAMAFEELVRRHFRAAYAVALAVLGSPADAEDVAQDSFIAAFERLEACRDPGRFSGWLVQIVRNRALNALEARNLRGRAADRLLDAENSAARPTPDRLSERDRLVAALEQITPVQREVVLLHDLDGWTHAEIAAAQGISEVMSRQHLFQARRVLRGILGDEQGSDDEKKAKEDERHEQR